MISLGKKLFIITQSLSTGKYANCLAWMQLVLLCLQLPGGELHSNTLYKKVTKFFEKLITAAFR